jgi:hypothetical protein
MIVVDIAYRAIARFPDEGQQNIICVVAIMAQS